MSARKRASPRPAADRPPSGSRAPSDGWTTALCAAALVAFVIAAYWPILHAGFIWDDDSYVTGNAIAAWAPLDGPAPYLVPDRGRAAILPAGVQHVLGRIPSVGTCRPSVTTSSMCCCTLQASVLMLWRLLVRLQVPGAWLAAALFAVHPVMVESVAWVTERKNVLSLRRCALGFAAVLLAVLAIPKVKAPTPMHG